jgi:hypothetical protein
MLKNMELNFVIYLGIGHQFFIRRQKMMKTTTVCHQISPEALGQHTTLVRTPET